MATVRARSGAATGGRFAALRRDVAAVIRVGLLHFCMRNGLDELRRAPRRSIRVAAVGVVVAAALASGVGAAVGVFVSVVGPLLGLTVTALSGLVLLAAAAQASVGAFSGATGGSRVAASQPVDLAVLRALDIGHGASILARVGVPRLVRALLWGSTGAFVVLGLGRGDAGGSVLATAAMVAVLPAVGAAGHLALVLRPAPVRGFTPIRLAVATGVAVAAGVALGAVLDLVGAVPVEDQWVAVVGLLDGLGSVVFEWTPAWIAGTVVMASVATTCAVRGFGALDRPPLVPVEPAAYGRRRQAVLRHLPWAAVPWVTVGRSNGRHAKLLRRTWTVMFLVGVVLTTVGATADTVLPVTGHGLGTVAGAGVLLAVAVVAADLAVAAAGPGRLSGALRWAVEQGAAAAAVAGGLGRVCRILMFGCGRYRGCMSGMT